MGWAWFTVRAWCDRCSVTADGGVCVQSTQETACTVESKVVSRTRVISDLQCYRRGSASSFEHVDLEVTLTTAVACF